MAGAWRMKLVAALLALSLVARGVFAGDEPAPAAKPEFSVLPLLPAQSLFVVSIKDKQKATERLKRTGLWKLLNDANVQDAFKGSLTVLKARMAVAEQKLGYKLVDLLDLFQGEITFAMCGFLDARNEKGEPIPDLILAIQPREKSQALLEHWNKIVDLLNAMTQNTLEISQRNVAGAEITTLSHPAVPFQITYTLHDGVFMATLGAGRIESVLAAREAAKKLAGAKPEGEAVMLAEHPQFARALDKGGKDADAIVFANLEELRKRPEANFGPKTDREKMEWERLGLTSIRSVTYTLGIRDSGLGEAFFIDAPEAMRAGLLRLLDGPALSADCFSQAPRNSVAAIALQAEPAKVLERVQSLAEIENPNARAEMQAAFDAASRKLGVDLRKDLMDSLAGDLILSVSMPAKHPKLAFGFPNVLLSAGLKDAGRVKAVMDGFRKSNLDKYDFAETTHGDYLIYGAREKQTAPGKDPGAFCWTVTSSRLIFALYPLALRDELDRLATGGSAGSGGNAQFSGSLADDGDFRAVRQQVPAASQLLAYVDFAAAATAAYDVFIPVGQLKQKSPPWVDINRLPGADLLVKNLGGTVINFVADADGVRVEAHSSTGIFSTLLPAVAVVGEHLKNRGGQEQLANEPELPPEMVDKRQFLRELGRHLGAYSKQNGGAYPGNLLDLVPKYLKPEAKDTLFELAYQGKQDKPFKVVAYVAGVKGPLPILLQDGSVRVIESGQLDGILKAGYTGEKAKPYEVEAAKPPLPPPDF